ncbi:MAG: CpsD/CapB family tyrosine-protein kinase, partial [Oscillospiraceae bacterium]|nr:CpsD/CapB family tyrosine-protein kinase [Oscillospiraceae bacterium]
MRWFGFKKKEDSKAAAKRIREEKIAQERRNLLTAKSDFFVREAYKALRTNVSFALAEDTDSHVIIITSSMQGEGKSITAMNLAISYAMTDNKVIVIDCDLRRPKVARLMKMKSKVGLSNLIINPDLYDEAILPTSVKGLDVMLSGDIPPNPSELLGSKRMQQLIAKLKEKYDYIFLDCPPVNMVTDAVVLAPQSDGVLFLVRANHTERGSVIHAIDQLEYAKAKILGFVLNGVGMENTHYGYKQYKYKGYSRYGRYGYGYSRRGYGYGYSRRGYGYGYGYG